MTHQFGHGKAEHLSALAEAAFLALVSIFISVRAIERLAGITHATVHVTWYAFAVLGVVIAIDLSRMVVSWRTARRYGSAALASNALHFGSDLFGSVAVLVGLVFAYYGYQDGDPIAALFVGVLVLLAAARLIKSNVDVLMDRAPAEAEAAALAAIGELSPAVEVRRIRMRQAGGRQFADIVIGVSRRRGRRPGSCCRRRRRGRGRARAPERRRRRARRADRGRDGARARARRGASRCRVFARSTISRSSTSTAEPSSRCT